MTCTTTPPLCWNMDAFMHPGKTRPSWGKDDSWLRMRCPVPCKHIIFTSSWDFWSIAFCAHAHFILFHSLSAGFVIFGRNNETTDLPKSCLMLYFCNHLTSNFCYLLQGTTFHSDYGTSSSVVYTFCFYCKFCSFCNCRDYFVLRVNKYIWTLCFGLLPSLSVVNLLHVPAFLPFKACLFSCDNKLVYGKIKWIGNFKTFSGTKYQHRIMKNSCHAE